MTGHNLILRLPAREILAGPPRYLITYEYVQTLSNNESLLLSIHGSFGCNCDSWNSIRHRWKMRNRWNFWYLTVCVEYIKLNQHPAVSRNQQQNLVLWKALRVEWRRSTPRLALAPEQRNENINVYKYFVSSSGHRTYDQSILQSHFVSLSYDWLKPSIYE